MIIRTPRKQRQRSSPPPPRVDVEAMREPSMRIAVYIDMDTVGACHSLREISLRNVDIHAVAAHASPHQRAASVVTPTSTRTAALDQIFLMVGVFAGSRGGCCCGLLAAPHIIVVTRDHERGSTLKALFLYDAATRRWQMYAAEMVNGCGIGSWEENSRIVRCPPCSRPPCAPGRA